MKDLTSTTFLGVGYSSMGFIFFGSTTIPSLEMIWLTSFEGALVVCKVEQVLILPATNLLLVK
jgi:hypothetical protein